MDRNDLTLAIAGALFAAFLLGWIFRGFFGRMNASGPRSARRTADLAAQLHEAEDARERSERRMARIEKEAEARITELRADLARCRETATAAEAQAEEVRAAYRTAMAERGGPEAS